MPRIIRSPAAETDAAEIWAYIAEDNPIAADRLLARFDRTVRNLASQPQSGKGVEELAPNLRFIVVGSYLIFYRPLPDGVEIARIIHGARDITAEFFRD
jgi:toxin ParE1/3/4